MSTCLVIGYGNTLRSDDAAGQQIAEIVSEWNLAEVRSLAVHQLTPELADPLSTAGMAIFIDVYVANGDSATVQVIELTPSSDPIVGLGHTADPRSLLHFTQQVYGTSPLSWWILVPAVNFEFGEQLSPTTQNGVMVALEQIQRLIQSGSLQSCSSCFGGKP